MEILARFLHFSANMRPLFSSHLSWAKHLAVVAVIAFAQRYNYSAFSALEQAHCILVAYDSEWGNLERQRDRQRDTERDTHTDRDRQTETERDELYAQRIMKTPKQAIFSTVGIDDYSRSMSQDIPQAHKAPCERLTSYETAIAPSVSPTLLPRDYKGR